MTLHPGSGREDRLLTAALAAIGLLCVMAFAVELAAGLSAWVSTGHWSLPAGDVVTAGLAIARHPASPADAWAPRTHAPGAVLFWLVLTGVVGATAGVGFVGWRMSRRLSLVGQRHDGFATRAEVSNGLGSQRILKNAALLRPSLADGRINADALSLDLGVDAASGVPLRASVEDSLIILGPSRSGKGTGLLIPNIVRWRRAGMPAVITSTRPDLIAHTLHLPGVTTPAEVWDPTGMTRGIPCAVWPIVEGCGDPDVAMLRANALVRSSSAGKGVSEGTYWSSSAEIVIRCLLHAAAFITADMRQVLRWAAVPTDPKPAHLLDTEPGAAEGWGEALRAIQTTGERERASIYGNVRTALAAFDRPSVLRSVCMRGGTQHVIRPSDVLDTATSVYLVGDAASQMSAAPVVAAFVESVVWEARRRAARSPHGRLDPPLGLFLDEVAQIAPLPSLPQLMADGGGSGITTTVVLQSLSQARDRWGSEGAGGMWDAASVRVVLGGLGRHEDLEQLSRLLPDVEVSSVATSRSDDGRWSESHSSRRVAALTVPQLRALPPGEALVLARAIGPVRARVEGWWRRPAYKHDVAAALAAYCAHVGPDPDG